MNWQPIETAPRDGTEILGYETSLFKKVIIIEWQPSTDGWYADIASQDGLGFSNLSVSHWMPLPQPPKENNA